jgi:hypothetical protein
VFDDPAILEEYSSDLSFVSGARPRFVVKPENAAQVRVIVKWANETGTPLVPVSSGGPHFRGDTLPGIGGAVVVDMSGMKRIIKIHDVDRVALIEPGVTYGELQAELQKHGLTTYLPLRPRATKAVVGALLERDPITQPNYHWDSLDPMLCAEIVLGTGDMIRTGEAAGPDTIEEQWEIGKSQMAPFGPGQYDQSRLLSGAQGTIGLATWASVKCRPLAEQARAFFVASGTAEPLIEAVYQILRQRIGNHCFIVNALNFACLLEQEPAEIAALAAQLPAWILVQTFEASGELAADKLEYQEADFRDILAAQGLEAVDQLGGVKAADVQNLLSEPSEDPWKLRRKGGVQEVFFQTTLDKTPSYAGTIGDAATACGFDSSNVGVYIQPTSQGVSCHCEFDLYFDPKRGVEVDAARALLKKGSEDLIREGAFFNRPYGDWAKLAYAQAATTTILHRKVKGIFDPNGVLNPGKLCF